MALRVQEEFFEDTDDQSVLKMMNESWEKNSSANQTYWLEGTRDLRFKAGDQNLWNELYTNYPVFQRKKFNFNRIRRIVNMISGHQRRTRNATTLSPMEGSDEQTADQFSTVINWAYQSIDAYNAISDAFEGALTTGMNLLYHWMDYRTDPINGELRLDNLSYNGFMIDQFFTKPDLSDANFVWIRKYLSREQAASLMPERRDEIMQMRGSGRDDKFTFQPENFNIQNTELLAYNEYWHLDYRPVTMLVDQESGETLEWQGEDKDLKVFQQQFPQVAVTKSQKQTVKLAIVINNRLMFHGPNPFGSDRYPFVPVLGYFEPDSPYYEWKIQGVVRQLRDAQFLYNRRKIIELDILESQINSGLKVMEDSLVDDNDAFLADQGRALFIKKDAPEGMRSVEPITPPGIPPSMIQLSQMLGEEINQISGVNEELLGSADDDKAGILSMLRQGAGLTTLQVLFDNLDRSQKLLGQLSMDYIQANYKPGKVQRIIGEQPTEQFFSKAFQKFDAVVSEGVLTDTQRKASAITLIELFKLGFQIPPELVLDKVQVADKKDLKDILAAQQEAQAKQQQEQQQLQLQQLEAEIKLANARATADEGLGLERLARIEENQELAVERRAKAIEDISDARLNRAKTLKELQDIDITQLEKLLELARRLAAEQTGELPQK
jgi:hypothetical protein